MTDIVLEVDTLLFLPAAADIPVPAEAGIHLLPAVDMAEAGCMRPAAAAAAAAAARNLLVAGADILVGGRRSLLLDTAVAAVDRSLRSGHRIRRHWRSPAVAVERGCWSLSSRLPRRRRGRWRPSLV